MRHSRPIPLLALLVLAACAPVVAPAGAPSSEETRLKKAYVALRGTVTAPTSLIGNDGSTLIGNDGSTLIGNDGSTLIGNDGSTMVAAGGGNYRLAAFAAAPLAGAMVYVATADGKPLKPLIKAKTDAQGRFTLTNVPAGRHVLVALGSTKEQQVASVLGLVTAIKAEDGIQLSAASSLVTGAVLEARAQGSLAEFDTPSYQRAVQLAEKGLAQGDAPDLTARKAVVASAQALADGDPELAKLLDLLKQQVAGLAKPSSGLPTDAPSATPTPEPTATPANGTGMAAGGLGAPETAASDGGAGAATPTPAPATTPGDDAGTPTPAPTLTSAPAGPVLVPGATVRLVAGTGAAGAADGAYASTTFQGPEAITSGVVDDSSFYVGEPAGRIRKLSNTNALGATVEKTFTWWDVPAGGKPAGLSVASGDLWVADAGRNLIARSLIVFDKLLQGSLKTYNGGGAAATFKAPRDVWADGKTVWVADTGNDQLKKITLTDDQVVAVGAGLNGPESVAVLGGTPWVADTRNHAIKRWDGTQFQLVAGGSLGAADGQGTAAQFNRPMGLAVAGNDLVVVDRGNQRLRLVSASGLVRTLAGAGGQGTFADPADATGVPGNPRAVWVTDAGGNKVYEVRW